MLKKLLPALFVFPVFCNGHAQSFSRLEASGIKTMTANQFITGHVTDGFDISFMPDTFVIRGTRLAWTIGYNLYYAWQGKVQVSGLPLDQPVRNFANAKVRNDLGGMNLFFRLARPVAGNKKFLAYLDLGGGYRYSNSNLVIRPEKHLDGYESVTRMKMGNTSGIDFMAGSGLVFSLSDEIGIHAGAQWTWSTVPGEMVDLGTVKKTGEYLELCTRSMTDDIVTLRLGLTFLIGSRGGYSDVSAPYVPSSTTGGSTTSTPEPESYSGPGSGSSSGSGCSFNLFDFLFSGCMGGGEDNSSSSSSGSTTTNTHSGGDKPNQVKIKTCCGEDK
jgi:hypothetical protein